MKLWAESRLKASLDSSVVREAGVTPAWSLSGSEQTRNVPCLLGETAGSLVFSPVKPPHARTEFVFPQRSSLGKIPVSASEGRLESQPASNFFGKYGDTWSMERIELMKGDRGSKNHGGVWGVAMAGQGVTERDPGPNTPGPIYDLGPGACAKQALSTRKSGVRVGMPPESSLDEKGKERFESYMEKRRNPGPADYSKGATRQTQAAGQVTESTLGKCASSSLRSEPTFTFTSKVEAKYNQNPGPGTHPFDSYKQLNGESKIASSFLGVKGE